MSNFKFERTCEETGCRVVQEFEAVTWTEALDHFVKFLRGSGYSLEDNSTGVNTDLHMFPEDSFLMNITGFSPKDED